MADETVEVESEVESEGTSAGTSAGTPDVGSDVDGGASGNGGAGGDSGGMQSAALVIVKKDGGVWLNNDVVLRLQVDDSDQPIVELRRLGEMAVRRWR